IAGRSPAPDHALPGRGRAASLAARPQGRNGPAWASAWVLGPRWARDGRGGRDAFSTRVADPKAEGRQLGEKEGPSDGESNPIGRLGVDGPALRFPANRSRSGQAVLYTGRVAC